MVAKLPHVIESDVSRHMLLMPFDFKNLSLHSLPKITLPALTFRIFDPLMSLKVI